MVARIRQLLELHQLSPTQFADRIGVGRPVVSHLLSGRNEPSLNVVQRIRAAFPDVALPWLLDGNGPMLALAGSAASSAPLPAERPAVVSGASGKASLAPLAAPVPAPARRSALRPVSPALAAADSLSARELITQASIITPPPPVGSMELGATATAAVAAPSPPTIPPAAASQPVTFQPVGSGAASALPLPAPDQQAAASASYFTAPPLAAAPPPLAAVPLAANGAAAPFAALAEPGKAIRRIVIFYRDGSFTDYQPE